MRQLTLREMAGSFASMTRQIGIEIFKMAGIGLMLGLFGPFGTFEMAPALRIAFWMGTAVLGYGIYRPMTTVGTWMSEALNVSHIIGIGLAQVIAALPLTFLIGLLFANFDVRAVLRWDGLGTLYFQVWLIGFLVYGFFVVAFRHQRGAVEAPPAAMPPMPTPPDAGPDSGVDSGRDFAARLPAGFGPVQALKGEDHYVRVFGETQETLVLIRLRDAIRELGAVEGMQVHRSWWVARAGVASARKDGRTAILVLNGGTEVPVSREVTPELRRLGWI